MKLAIKKGTTSKRVMVFIQDSTSTTGAGKTGLTSASVTCYYCREDDGDVGGTAVSLVSATRGTWTSGGFVEKDATNQPGFYEVGLPNAALVTGADWVNFHIKGTGIAMLPLEIQLTDNTTKDVYDRIGAPAGASLAADVAAVEAQTDDIGVAGAGLTALGDARLGNLDAAVSTRAPEAAGNLAAIKAKTDQLAFTVANRVDSTVIDKTGFAIGTGGIAAAAFAASAVDAAALAQNAAQEVADECLNRNLAGGGSGGARTVQDSLRVLRNRRAISAGTLTVYQEDDATSAWTAAVTTAAGNPISEIDPA